MQKKIGFHKEILFISDVDQMCNKIIEKLRDETYNKLNRHGGVIGISGGIDSSVTLALSVKAFGSERILGIMLPERESSPESERLALLLAKNFNIKTIKEDITGALNGFKCYERRDEAVAKVFPEYNPIDYKMKIGIKSSPESSLPPVFSVIIIDKEGNESIKKLSAKDYLQIVASSNFKQRCRMSMLYYHAERLHYAVIGTPNKHEVDQGFFVKYGDGGADIMPIGNLYKTQVYQIANYLGIPKEIIDRTPTTDTYSAEQTQEEFFYQLPFNQMDLLWYAYENNYDPVKVANVMGKTEKEVNNIFMNFKRKNKTTQYLRQEPIREF